MDTPLRFFTLLVADLLHWARALFANRRVKALSFVLTLTCREVSMVRNVIAGVLLLSGLGIDSAWALDRTGPKLDTKSFDERSYCERRLHGKFFSRTELIFGLSRVDAPNITEEEFQHFIDTSVTPSFPEGLTVLSGTGQFSGSAGGVIKEGAKLLILFYPSGKQSNEAIEQIRATYKSAFQQESVLRADELSCVSF